jgi:aryl-alcohol dehydrogenase-like predicted oxidoreductase
VGRVGRERLVSLNTSAMELRPLGSLNVSRIGLGCVGFGWKTTCEESDAIVSAALDCGINFFDTANIYGDGRSEEFLGKSLRGRRDQAVIATKFGYSAGADRSAPDFTGAGRSQIVRAVEESLKRLGADCIDLYQQHAPDPAVDYCETLEALHALVASGKVREIGSSRFEAEHIRAAERVADQGRLTKFVSCQNALNVLRRDALEAVLPACRELGLGLIAFNPLAVGFLAGSRKSLSGAAAMARLRAIVETDEGQRSIKRLADYAVSHGRTPAELAIAWVAAQPGVTTVLAGASRPEQVIANAGRGLWELTPQQLEEIDALVA